MQRFTLTLTALLLAQVAVAQVTVDPGVLDRLGPQAVPVSPVYAQPTQRPPVTMPPSKEQVYQQVIQTDDGVYEYRTTTSSVRFFDDALIEEMGGTQIIDAEAAARARQLKEAARRKKQEEAAARKTAETERQRKEELQAAERAKALQEIEELKAEVNRLKHQSAQERAELERQRQRQLQTVHEQYSQAYMTGGGVILSGPRTLEPARTQATPAPAPVIQPRTQPSAQPQVIKLPEPPAKVAPAPAVKEVAETEAPAKVQASMPNMTRPTTPQPAKPVVTSEAPSPSELLKHLPKPQSAPSSTPDPVAVKDPAPTKSAAPVKVATPEVKAAEKKPEPTPQPTKQATAPPIVKTPPKKNLSPMAVPVSPVQSASLTEQPTSSLPAPAADVLLRVPFEKGKKALADDQAGRLNVVAERLKGSPTTRVSVVAYAGSKDDANTSSARRLSLERALKIRASLLDQGVDNTQINVRALGAAADVEPVDRVDIVVK